MMPALHPEDGLRHASFDGRGQAALASRDAREADSVEDDMGEGRNNHARNFGRRRRPREVELCTLLDATREEGGTVAALCTTVEATIAAGVRLGAQQPKRLLGLAKEVVANILGHAHSGLVALPEVVILPDLDVLGCAVFEILAAADLKVVAPPDFARLKLSELLATAAGERARVGGQAVEPLMEEGLADRATGPAFPGVWRLDARARRVGRQ